MTDYLGLDSLSWGSSLEKAASLRIKIVFDGFLGIEWDELFRFHTEIPKSMHLCVGEIMSQQQ